ncbi:MAG: hypothetical protein I8H67_03485 [Comamonadaceae bacterium]|nr:hypothetical protein [Comamonadaceae bacterium]
MIDAASCFQRRLRLIGSLHELHHPFLANIGVGHQQSIAKRLGQRVPLPTVGIVFDKKWFRIFFHVQGIQLYRKVAFVTHQIQNKLLVVCQILRQI